MNNENKWELRAQIKRDGIWAPAGSMGAVKCGDTFRVIEFDGSLCKGTGKLKNTTEFTAWADAKPLPDGTFYIQAAGRVKHETVKN